ncbi:hypothetical protein ACFGVR_22770 [Mucilaginibacter sp. AW1-3]
MMTKEELAPFVDYDKSLAKQRLVYKFSGWYVIDWVLLTGLFSLLAIEVLYVGYEEYSRDNNYPYLAIGILSVTWLIASFVFLNKLVAVKGTKTMLKNREDVRKTLAHFYDDLTYNYNSKNIIRDVVPTKWSNGRILTVIFDESNDNIYFHRATLIRGSSISPVSGWINYWKCKNLAKHFKELQAKSLA